MNINEVILKLRSLLRDTNYENLRFSDNELLESIEYVQNELIAHFSLNIQEYELIAENRILYLPTRILSLIKVSLNNQTIPLKTHKEVILNNTAINCIYQINAKEYRLNFDSSYAIKIYGNFAIDIPSDNEPLFIDKLFLNALYFGVLKNILFIETNANNLQKAAYYQSKYDDEIFKITALLNAQREKHNYITPYIIV